MIRANAKGTRPTGIRSAPGHEGGCDGVPRGHVERVPGESGRRDAFRIVLRCRCSRLSAPLGLALPRFAEAEMMLRRIG